MILGGSPLKRGDTFLKVADRFVVAGELRGVSGALGLCILYDTVDATPSRFCHLLN